MDSMRVRLSCKPYVQKERKKAILRVKPASVHDAKVEQRIRRLKVERNDYSTAVQAMSLLMNGNIRTPVCMAAVTVPPTAACAVPGEAKED